VPAEARNWCSLQVAVLRGSRMKSWSPYAMTQSMDMISDRGARIRADEVLLMGSTTTAWCGARPARADGKLPDQRGDFIPLIATAPARHIPLRASVPCDKIAQFLDRIRS